MKLYLVACLLIFTLVLYASGENISEDEIAELISDYKNLYKNYEGEKNAPVSTLSQYNWLKFK